MKNGLHRDNDDDDYDTDDYDFVNDKDDDDDDCNLYPKATPASEMINAMHESSTDKCPNALTAQLQASLIKHTATEIDTRSIIRNLSNSGRNELRDSNSCTITYMHEALYNSMPVIAC
jgi:hypothetical protein